MVNTREVILDPKTFFRVLLRLNFRLKTRILYSAAALLAVTWLILYPAQKQFWLLLAAVAIFPLIGIFLTWRTAHSTMNRNATAPRSYTIGEAQITAHLPGGQQETFDLAHIHRVNRAARYYLLFTTPVEFIYLPYEAFRSEADREWFERNIVSRAKTVRKS